jgi:hypothetical protein
VVVEFVVICGRFSSMFSGGGVAVPRLILRIPLLMSLELDMSTRLSIGFGGDG